jgi:hypothetical protein
MPDPKVLERRAREAEELAGLVSRPQNRERYLAIAQACRELMAVAEPPTPKREDGA